MFKKFIYTHDWIITTIAFAILALGVITIFSTTVGVDTQQTFSKQVVFAITGVFIYFLISLIDYSYLKYKPIVFILYGLDILLLLLDYLAGHNIRGASRWLGFGFVNFQPSEFTKIIMIIALGAYLAISVDTGYKRLLKIAGIVFPLVILVFIEPSLSASFVIFSIAAVMYFFSSEHPGSILALCTLGLLTFNLGAELMMPKIAFLPVLHGISIGMLVLTVAGFIGIYLVKLATPKILTIICITTLVMGLGARYVVWNKILHPYQRERIIAFITPNTQTNSTTASFQIDQSKIAIGSGQLSGKGFAQGTQSKLDFLPDHNTDFIFASFSEEFGLIGDFILLSLFVALYFRIIHITESVQDRFGFFMMVGIITFLVLQTFTNIGINLGLLPATGVPMPLVSYGGSSLWVTVILLGCVQSIYRQSLSKKWLGVEI